MGKVTKVTTRKTTMVWLLNHAKGDLNLHDFWTHTALKLEHISHWGGGVGGVGGGLGGGGG